MKAKVRWEYCDGWYILRDAPFTLLVSTRKVNSGALENLIRNSISLKQVHSSLLLPALKDSTGQEGDGFWGRGDSDLIVSVKTADCYPVALMDSKGEGFALLHAGWRGIYKGILQEGVRKLEDLGVPPKRVMAAFGPGICGRCYEVGKEVVQLFFERYGDLAEVGVETVGGRVFLDLFKIGVAILRDMGLESFLPPPGCTFESSLFPSYRRGDREERIYTFLLPRRRTLDEVC